MPHFVACLRYPGSVASSAS